MGDRCEAFFQFHTHIDDNLGRNFATFHFGKANNNATDSVQQMKFHSIFGSASATIHIETDSLW